MFKIMSCVRFELYNFPCPWIPDCLKKCVISTGTYYPWFRNPLVSCVRNSKEFTFTPVKCMSECSPKEGTFYEGMWNDM